VYRVQLAENAGLRLDRDDPCADVEQ